jgi:hypothetical protein
MPAKEDYFPGIRSVLLPVHPLVWINRYTFDYIWRYFHTTFKECKGDTFNVLEQEEEAETEAEEAEDSANATLQPTPPDEEIEEEPFGNEEIEEEPFGNHDDVEDLQEEVKEPFWYEHIRYYKPCQQSK